MNAYSHPADLDIPSFMQNQAPSKTRAAGLLAWLLGSPTPPGHDARVIDEPIEPLPGPDEVRVAPPQLPQGNYWVEIFLNAVTEATTLFAQRHVALLHAEDPSTVYGVREVKFECHGAPAQFQREIGSLPEGVRNRAIKGRMSKAAGAKDLLVLDGFYGATPVPDISVVDGQVVQTLLSYAGCRFVLKFAFEGDYLTLPASAVVTAPAHAPATVLSQANVPPAPQGPLDAVDKPPASGAASSVERDPATETVLRSSVRPTPPLGVCETVLRGKTDSQLRPIATLHLRSQGEQCSLPLMARDFPYAIGRHASFKGYSVRGQHDAQSTQVLHAEEPTGFMSFVSRDHIVLDSYDSLTRQYRVIASKGKNGSFFKNATASSHFLLPQAEMDNGHWLKLGGMNGDGILEIKIEAV